MEALRQDDPRHFGPYTALARLREAASAVQFLARDSAGARVVVTAARPGLAAVPAFRRRFQAEARTAERLAGGWVQPLLAGPGSGDEGLWTAVAYVPGLTLAEAISLTGPLPERAVRILGAGLAETLSRVHATGAVLQGLAPETVLLAGDGPRLTAFGPLGGAAGAEAKPGGQLSVRLGYLTPEQVEGREAGAPSDLFVLGLLLAYAATGATPFAEGPAEEAAARIAHGSAELGPVPDALRELIGRCLAKDPADRPGAGAVAAELALEGAAGMAKGGWLPEAVAAAVTDQAARAGALEASSETEAESETGTEEGPETGADEVPEPDAGPDAVSPDTVPATVPPGAAPEPGPGDGLAAEPADAVPDAAGAPGPEGPGGFGPAAGGPAVPEPADAVPAKALPPAPAAAGPGTATGGEDGGTDADTRTTRFLRAGPRPPWTDRSTAQLALPRELTGPPAPGTPGSPLPPAAPASAPEARQPYPYAYPAAPVPLPQTQAQSPVPPATAPAAAGGTATGRRALLTAVAAGAAGLVVGGGSVLALGSDEPAAATDDKPAPAPRPTVPGQAPGPLWIHTRPASAPAPLTAGIWRDELLVLTDSAGATGIDLRTGREKWKSKDAAGGQKVLAAGDESCFLASPTEFLWLSPEDGKVEHRVRFVDQFDGVPNMKVAPLTGQSGSVLWFTGSHTVTVKAPKPKKGKKPGKDRQVPRAYFFAYDIVLRKEVWRVEVPAGRDPGTPAYRLTAVRDTDILVLQSPATLTAADVKAAKGKAFFRCFDRTTGKLLWNRQFGAVSPQAAALGDTEGRLYAAVGEDLHAFETGTGKPVWTLPGGEGSVFGTPVRAAGNLLHTTNRNQEVGAVDAATGRQAWRRSTEVPLGGNAPALTLSGGGGTLLASDPTQVTAFAAADGRRLWKFQDIGAADPKGATVSAPYRVLAAGKNAVVQRERAFYAFPVE
ncbi:serine/threonine protein kinase [Streptomyces nitrosporeus]|uniref:Serine/threonine protein kinase n=1 Tax=Streptomyces nitrosporeus TaxID=28894 RepID=A0A5J6F827_9ACTN|nr:PQQ-binding-like beta-propeller repeat protein [Streptomyces nitrosporeus]QEU72362.1 serine/threonine protein kinase [Streptomyces nitrosporeus]GGY78537.1 hypothetical protein GCM10010327_06000 [Streptomyces nitrosporeus]